MRFRKHARYDLGDFSLSGMAESGTALRHLSSEANCFEETASLLVNRIRNSFINPSTGQRSIILARFFLSVPYDNLEIELQECVRSVLTDRHPTEDMRCLTLLATAGEKPEWNSRALSQRHKVFPLISDSLLRQSPMLMQLIKQLGLSPGSIVKPDPHFINTPAHKTLNVFYVAEAKGSNHVPDQADFVDALGIRSVLGFGGMLPLGNLFVVILFSRDYIPPQTAILFKYLALSVKLAILPFVRGPIFRSLPGCEPVSAKFSPGSKLKEEPENFEFRMAALEQLIEVHGQAVQRQSRHLERTLKQNQKNLADLARSEKDLREKENILRSILSSMSDGVAVADKEGRFLEFNPAAERILRIGQLQADPARWAEEFGLHLPDKSALYPADQLPLVRAIRGESADEVEIYVTRRDLQDGVWLSVNARPLLDSSGAAMGGVAVFRDITVWKKSIQNAERLYAAVESTDDAVFITGLDGKIDYVNPAFERMTGYSRLEAVGKTPRILKSGFHESTYYKSLWDNILKGNVHRGMNINRKKNGEIFYAEQTITPIRDPGGQLTHFVAVVKDITERRKLLAQEVEMRLAAQVQARLYPRRLPRLAGCDIASVVLPAEPTCGDCFDFITMPCGLPSIIIGDVSGHGLGPALVMAETRAYLRSLALNECDPGGLLTRANKMLHADLEDERYVTLCCAQLDIPGRCLTYANAGHPPGYVLNSSGAIKATMESCGPPLGMFRQSEYACSQKIMLEAGDILVLLTDGATDTAAPDGQEFGIEGILEVIRTYRHESAKEILHQVQEALRNFSKGLPQMDDVTMMIVKLDAEPLLSLGLPNGENHHAGNCVRLPTKPDSDIWRPSREICVDVENHPEAIVRTRKGYYARKDRGE